MGRAAKARNRPASHRNRRRGTAAQAAREAAAVAKEKSLSGMGASQKNDQALMSSVPARISVSQRAMLAPEM